MLNLIGVESEIRVVFEGDAGADGRSDPAEAVLAAARDQYATLCGSEKAAPSPDLGSGDGMFLQNGARLYNDHGYVEYSTPECSLTSDAVAAVRAGDLIVRLAAEKAQEGVTGRPRIAAFRNNRDYATEAHSCGAHVNVRMSRPGFERIFADPKVFHGFVVPFFVCLPVVCGSGTITDHGRGEEFGIWQRAPFLKELVALHTTFDRPLVNTRDESLDADPMRYARFHVIAFDANVAEVAEFCKLGLLRLLCAAIDADRIDVGKELEDPLGAIRSVSRDPAAPLTLASRKTITPVQLLNAYVEAFEKMHGEGVFSGRVPDAGEILIRSTEVLARLERDPFDLVGVLDWPTKFVRLERFRDVHGLEWSSPRVKWLDVEYHRLKEGRAPFGALRRITTDGQVRRLVGSPPKGSRAEIRGRMISRFGKEIAGSDWSFVSGKSDHTLYFLPDDPSPADVRRLGRVGNLKNAARSLKLASIDVLPWPELSLIVPCPDETRKKDPATTT